MVLIFHRIHGARFQRHRQCVMRFRFCRRHMDNIEQTFDLHNDIYEDNITYCVSLCFDEQVKIEKIDYEYK